MATDKVTYRLDLEILQRIKEASATRGVTQTDLVTMALREFLDGKESTRVLKAVHQEQQSTVTELRSLVSENNELRGKVTTLLNSAAGGREAMKEDFQRAHSASANQVQAVLNSKMVGLDNQVTQINARLLTLETILRKAMEPPPPQPSFRIGFGIAAALVGIAIGVAGLVVLRTAGFV